jgi:hypothetical protein
MRGRLSDQARQLRDELETAQAILLTCAVDLDEVTLRIRQAMRRTPLVGDVLRPALKRVERIHQDLELAQSELSKTWKEKQARKWRG